MRHRPEDVVEAFTVLFFVSTGLIRFVGPVSTEEAIQITSPGCTHG